MKAFRKVIALMLAVMMVSAFGMTAASAKAVVDKFEVIEFGIFNEAGTQADTLAAGKTITVKATLQRVSGANNVEEKATVYAAVYSGSELVDVQGSTKTYLFAGTTQENNLTLTIPEGKENLTLRAFLWDGANAIKPLAKSSDKAEITGITIGGVAVENFDTATKTYDITLPLGTDEEPGVSVAATGILDAKVSYNNGVATVTADNDTYTINYTITQPTISNMVYTYGAGATYPGTDTVNLTETGVLRKADSKITEAAGTEVTLASALGITDISKLKEYASPAYIDAGRRASIYYDIPDELVGANYVPMRYYKTGGGNYRDGARVRFEFEINADTQIWFVGFAWKSRNRVIYTGANGIYESDPGDVDSFGAANIKGDDERITVTQVSTETDVISVLQIDEDKFSDLDKAKEGNQTLKGIATKENPYFNLGADSSGNNALWTATLKIPEGQTSAKYVIEGRQSKPMPFTFAYKFIPESEKELNVSGKINNADISFNGLTAMKPVYVKDTNAESTTNGKYFLGTEADLTYDETTHTTTTAGGQTVWSKYACQVTGGNYQFIHSLPDEVIGAKVLRWNDNNFGGQSSDAAKSGTSMLTLTIDKDATVYIDTTDEFAEKSGAVKMAQGIGISDIKSASGKYEYNGCQDTAYTEDDINGLGNVSFHQGRLFKLELKVPEGKETETFEIPLAWDTKPNNPTRPFLFIK